MELKICKLCHKIPDIQKKFMVGAFRKSIELLQQPVQQ